MEDPGESDYSFSRVLGSELTALRVRGIRWMDNHRSGPLPIPYLRAIAARWSMSDVASRDDVQQLLSAATRSLNAETAEVVRLLFGLDDESHAGHTPRTLLDAAYELPGFTHSADRSRERRRSELIGELAEQVIALVESLVDAADFDFVDGGVKRHYSSEAGRETRYQLNWLRAQVMALYLAAERWQLMPWWRLPARIHFATALIARVLLADRAVQSELDNPFTPPSYLVRRAADVLGRPFGKTRPWLKLHLLARSVGFVGEFKILRRKLWQQHPIMMLRLYRQLSPRRPLRAPGMGKSSADIRVSLVWHTYKWAAQMGISDDTPAHEVVQELVDILLMRDRGVRRQLPPGAELTDLEMLSFRRPRTSPVVAVPPLDDGDLARRIDLLWIEAVNGWLAQKLSASAASGTEASTQDRGI